MYINPFFAGVVCTVFAEILIIIAIALTSILRVNGGVWHTGPGSIPAAANFKIFRRR